MLGANIAEDRRALEKQQMFNYPDDGYFEVFLLSITALRRARQTHSPGVN